MVRAVARTILRAFDNVIYPRHCLISGQPLGNSDTVVPGISDDAWFALQPSPSSAALIAMLARRFDRDTLLISDAHALWSIDEEGAMLRVVHAIKYGGRRRLAAACGRVLGDVMTERGVSVDVVVPVPIHRARLRERGYNQSEMIALGIHEATGVPIELGAIKRNTHTKTQTKKGRDSRWDNVAEIFSLTNPEKLEGKYVLLVDDVLTTGATLEACGSRILAAPNVKLAIATVAYA